MSVASTRFWHAFAPAVSETRPNYAAKQPIGLASFLHATWANPMVPWANVFWAACAILSVGAQDTPILRNQCDRAEAQTLRDAIKGPAEI